jgi:Zn finger protein HypA/HybF involved in hydrogenase expression
MNKELYECSECDSTYVITIIDSEKDHPKYCPCCGSDKIEIYSDNVDV